MDFIGLLLVLLQVSSATRRSIQVTGEIGGSISIKCPTTSTSGRKFLCRELETTGCVTIISTSPFISENYKNRTSLTVHSQEGIFQITMSSLEEEDAGLYTCGTGNQNNRGSERTLQVKLKVSNGNAPSQMGVSAESRRRDQPSVISPPQRVVPAESSNKGAGTQAVTQPQTINRATTKYTSYTALATRVLETLTVLPAEVIASTTTSTYTTTGSPTKGIPKNSRTTNSAQHMRANRLVRRSGRDVFEILIPVLLFILLLVASTIIVRKQLRRKKEAASSETCGINLRLSALEPVQEHMPVENIYSICPRKLQGAERNSSHGPHVPYHCSIAL